MSKPFGDAFSGLCNVMDRLREDGGCPWDRVQTLETLRPYLVEETYEVLDALDKKDVRGHREELGDLIFQVVFQSRVRSEEAGGFDVGDVCDGIREKLVRRHPHVFGPDAGAAGQPTTADAVLNKWEQLKRAERAGASILSGVPPTLPALLRAQRVGEKAARVGFDWADSRGVVEKIKEELAELEEAMALKDSAATRHELGDLLFATVQLSRFLKHSAEDALGDAIGRFTRRFRHIEDSLAKQKRTPETCSLDELEALWQQAKKLEQVGALAEGAVP